MYQIIRMEPHPLAPSVPGLPQDVETVLRRSLRKRPEDRFASIREFSHAFESAALGRPADETPVPMLVGAPAEPLSMSLFELEETQIAETSGPEVVPAASVSHVELPADAGSPISVTDIVHLQPQRRLRPALVLTAGAGIGLLLLLGAFLLFRSSPGPKPQIPKNNDTLPVVSPPVVGQPSVTPLASPPPAPTENIAPDPKHVKSTGFETEFARLKRAKAPAPNSSPRQDKSGHPGVQTPRPKPKRQLIEEL
jgi:hypothetical protein